LEDLVSALRRSESQSLLLQGEAGIGKTALLEHLVASASDGSLIDMGKSQLWPQALSSAALVTFSSGCQV